MQQPDASFEETVGRIFDDRLKKAMSEQLPKLFDRVVGEVVKEVKKDMGDLNPDTLVENAVAKINLMGEEYRQKLEGQVKSNGNGKDAGPAVVEPDTMTPGERIVKGITGNWKDIIDYAFKGFEMIEARKNPFTYFQALQAQNPKLAEFIGDMMAPDPLQAQLPFMLGQNSMNTWNKAYEQGQKDLKGSRGSAESPNPTEGSERSSNGLSAGSDVSAADSVPDLPEVTMASLFN